MSNQASEDSRRSTMVEDLCLCLHCRSPLVKHGKHMECENPVCPHALIPHLFNKQGRVYVQRV